MKRIGFAPPQTRESSVERPHHEKGLQHSLNNPLAALLAELQLLELEELSPDHRESVERAIDLCRRVISLVRERIPPNQE